MAFLELSHLHKSFNHAVAVQDFSLSVERGEFVSLLGPSGCGKTTVLRMVAGFETPTSGQIVINGREVTQVPPNQRHIGMVFQSYALFPNLTAAGNIGFGLQVAGKPKTVIEARVREMLDLVRLPEFGTRYPYQLSGGQQQRVALARALAPQPEVLLLDEPLSALDAKVRAEVRDEIRRIQKQLGITTLFVTHDQEEAMSISDRVVVMSKGQIEQAAPPFEVYNYPRTAFVASFVGTLNQLTCTVANAAQGHLRHNGSTFLVPGPLRQAEGAQVVLMLRPEELRLGKAEGLNQLTGTVQSVSFLGAVVRVKLLHGLSPITLDLFNERNLKLPEVGQAYIISFPPHACWIMGENAEDHPADAHH